MTQFIGQRSFKRHCLLLLRACQCGTGPVDNAAFAGMDDFIRQCRVGLERQYMRETLRHTLTANIIHQLILVRFAPGARGAGGPST